VKIIIIVILNEATLIESFEGRRRHQETPFDNEGFSFWWLPRPAVLCQFEPGRAWLCV